MVSATEFRKNCGKLTQFIFYSIFRFKTEADTQASMSARQPQMSLFKSDFLDDSDEIEEGR